jgi:hypothetical protein
MHPRRISPAREMSRRWGPWLAFIAAMAVTSAAFPASSTDANPLTAALRVGWQPFAAHAGEFVDIECTAPGGARAMLPKVQSSVIYLRKDHGLMICQVTGEACTHNSCTEFNTGGQ